MQGWLDPIEGVAQLAEHTTGWHLAPKELKDWARSFRSSAQSTVAGQAGELAGNVFNPAMLIPGAGVARGVGAIASRLPGAARAAAAFPGLIRGGGAAISGAVGGAMEPVSSGGDYRKTKQNQIAGGALTGGAFAPVARGVQAGARGIGSHMPAWVGGFGIPQGIENLARRAKKLPPAAVGRATGETIGQRPEGEDEEEDPPHFPLKFTVPGQP
jgi:hypothetical protein